MPPDPSIYNIKEITTAGSSTLTIHFVTFLKSYSFPRTSAPVIIKKTATPILHIGKIKL